MPGDRTPSAKVLPDGWYWEPCKLCGCPTVSADTGSVNGGRISFGCGRCLCKALDVLENIVLGKAGETEARAELAKYGRPHVR